MSTIGSAPGASTGATDSAAQAALRGAVRPRRWGAWYIAEHEFRLIRPWLQGFFVTSFGNPLLYLFAMGIGLGGLISAHTGPNAIDGVSYLTFVAPALLANAALLDATEQFTFPVLQGFFWNPVFFAMNAAPISAGQIVGGLTIFATTKVFVGALIYFGFMLAFGAVPSALGILSVLVAVLTAISFGVLVGAYLSSLKRDSSQVNFVFRFVVVPLSLFSGTYFPLTNMPIFLQWIGWISPLWHGSQLARDAVYGTGEPVWLTIVHVAYLLALLITGLLLMRHFAARKLAR